MSAARSYWMVKQEPEAYSFSDFLRDKTTDWTGIRNYQARNHLAAMRKGDQVLFYHSVSEKSVVGTASVVRTAFPDPTADGDDRWLAVTLKVGRALPHPVPLAVIKADRALADLPLLRQSRLSVMPLNESQYQHVLRLAEG